MKRRRVDADGVHDSPGLLKGSCAGIMAMGRADSWPATVATIVLISSSLRLSSASTPALAGLPNLQRNYRIKRPSGCTLLEKHKV